MDILSTLYDTITKRRENPAEGSYTAYLFREGTDKILKKCGEETAELIVAAKNGEPGQIVGEASDLLYHLLVLLNQQNVPLSDVYAELQRRHQKQGNLKTMKVVDKNS